jgi:peroxiredoxin
MPLRSSIASLTALSLALLAGSLALADQPEQKKPDAPAAAAAPKEDAKDDAAPAAATPKVTANVSPDARQVIDQVDAAYGKIQKLELAGTFSADLDAAGQKLKDSKPFTATYAAPNKFRHVMQEDILVGSTGDKVYAYMDHHKLFAQADAPKEKGGLEKFPEPLPQVMPMQNPALMFAVVKSAAAEMTGSFSDIRKVDDTKLDGEQAAYQTLLMTLPNKMVVTMLFHPQTHLLRQASTDLKPMFESRGTPSVKHATMVVNYTTVKANDEAKVADDQFAWAPPEGARDQAEMAAAPGGGGGAPGEAAELEGKPAPAFAVKGIDDRQVSLKDLKGKVVVIDMWATWCPPCRASLPHLDKLYEDMKDKGVAIYALNVQEDKEDVQNFIKTTNLKTPVLLDADGSVSQAYRATGIPETVVIGRDGVIKKVIVGFGGEDTAKELRQAVEAAMK